MRNSSMYSTCSQCGRLISRPETKYCSEECENRAQWEERHVVRKSMNPREQQQICDAISKISPYIRFVAVINKMVTC